MRYAGPALLALVLAGCSSTPPAANAGARASSAGGSTSGAPATPANAAASYDVNKVCSLLTVQEIKAATGTAVTVGQIRDSQAGQWVECRYEYVGDNLSIVRVQLATPSNAAAYFDAAKQDVTTDAMKVPGADDARWDSAFGTVYVVKGGVSFFVQIEDGKTVDQAKTEALTELALANISRLS
jgi:hypothetical protein